MDDTITPDPIMQIASGFMAAKFLFAANEFGFFDALQDSPADRAALAARTGLPERSTRILADGCVSLGLLDKVDDVYTNSPVANRFLTRGGLAAGLRFWDKLSYPAWASFTDTLAHGRSTSVVQLPPEMQQIMLAGIEAIVAGPTHALVGSVDFSDRQRLLDLGCGTGSWSTAVLHANPHLTATLIDVPAAIGTTRHHVQASGVADRAQIVGADILSDPLPGGHDVVMANNLLHYFSPENNKKFLSRVAAVTEPDSLLVMADFWTDATHTRPAAAALMAGEFAAHIVEGDVYSVDEIADWLGETGWTFVRQQPLAGPQSAVVATRA